MQYFTLTGGSHTINGEYEGNDTSHSVVVLVHGFGVLRDSRGLFTELSLSLRSRHQVVKLDLSVPDAVANTTTVLPFSIQAQYLDAVLKFVRDQLRAERIQVLAHSQGCLVAGLNSSAFVDHYLLAASPIAASYQRMRSYFLQKEGANIDERAVSRLPRSDGSTTIIPPAYWRDIKTIEPMRLFESLSHKTQTTFIRALDDEVILDTEYPQLRQIPNLSFTALPGDHNFTGQYRQPFIAHVKALLE